MDYIEKWIKPFECQKKKDTPTKLVSKVRITELNLSMDCIHFGFSSINVSGLLCMARQTKFRE